MVEAVVKNLAAGSQEQIPKRNNLSTNASSYTIKVLVVFQQPAFWQSGKHALPLDCFAQQGAQGPVLTEAQGLQAAHSPVTQISHLSGPGAGGLGAGPGAPSQRS